MSMTLQEAAIKSCEDRIKHLESTPIHHYGKRQRERAIELERVKIAALRPVSREQVEKVWRGCEKCNGAGEYSRYAENLTKTLLAKYCPHCGRPLTAEAVDMVMERLEVMKDGNSVKI